MFDEKEQHRMWDVLQHDLRLQLNNQLYGQLKAHLWTRIANETYHPLWKDMSLVANQIGVQMRVRGSK